MNNYLSKVWFILEGSRKKLPFLILIFSVTSFLEVLGIGIIGPFFALVSDPTIIHKNSFLNSIYYRLHISSEKQFIAYLGIFIIIVFIIKSIFYFLGNRYVFKFCFNQRAKIVSKLFNKYLFVPYSFYFNKNTATIINRITSETHFLLYSCLLPLLSFISSSFTALVIVVLLFKTDIRLMILVMLFSLPTLIVFLSFRNEVKITGSQTSASLQETIKIVNHSLTSFKELKVIGCENYFQAQIKEETKKYAKCGVNSQSYIMLPKIFLETSMIVSIISFIILSQFFVENTQIGITSVLAVFSIGAVRLIPTLNGCFSSLNQINHSAHAVDMIFSDLKEENQIRSLHQKYPNKNQKADCVDHSFLQENTCGVDYTHEIACLEFKDKIELTNVFYQYPSTLEPSINGVSLSIVKGQSIAFIGKSGAGKTTLVDILLGLLNLESGDIRVDNKSIYSNIRLWQNIIGYIPQSICLLDDTIQKNIAFGVDDKLIDKDKLLRSVKLAQLEKLIQELPDGLFTKVGERGILLSGGQRQRIGIARALYHQREILVMDEATSALDNETEKLVNESIKSLSGQLTIVIIAHRLSTVEHCDKVYLLEKGCVVDSGTYEEIISRNKIK